MRPLLLIGLGTLLAWPATAQQAFTWPSSRVTVTQRGGNACQPAILEVSGMSGGRSLRLRVNSPVEGSLSATLEVTLRAAGQVLSYRGGENLRRGIGSIHVAGPEIPANLAGSTIEVLVAYCQVYAPAPPPPPPTR